MDESEEYPESEMTDGEMTDNEMDSSESSESNDSEPRLGIEENTVYIGRKPAMAYVFAVMTQFDKDTKTEVVLKARGKSISKAVDVAEIMKNKFPDRIKIADIVTTTEEMQSEDGRTVKVSSIELKVVKLN